MSFEILRIYEKTLINTTIIILLWYSKASIFDGGQIPRVSTVCASSGETPVISLVHCKGRVSNGNRPIKV